MNTIETLVNVRLIAFDSESERFDYFDDHPAERDVCRVVLPRSKPGSSTRLVASYADESAVRKARQQADVSLVYSKRTYRQQLRLAKLTRSPRIFADTVARIDPLPEIEGL